MAKQAKAQVTEQPPQAAEQPTLTPEQKNDGRERINQVWKTALKRSEDSKAYARFKKGAKFGVQYYNGPHDHVYQQMGKIWNVDSIPQVTLNKSFELVKIFGPFLYQENPVRVVENRARSVKMAAMAKVQHAYLNYTPNELHLKRETRDAIDESLIKGRGVLWSGVDTETGLVGTFFVSVDDIRIDPDCERVSKAWWMARRRVEPKWYLEQLYGDAAKDAKPMTIEAGSDKNSATSDMVRFWEIFSKMGVGVRLKDAGIDDEALAKVDDGNDYKYIVIADDGCDKPLYIGDWPAPLHLDGEWFSTFLDFHSVPNECWPLSTLSAAEGEQKAMDFLSSMILVKAKNQSKEIVLLDSDAPQALKDAVKRDLDMVIAEVKKSNPNMRLNDYLSFAKDENPSVSMQPLMDALSLMQTQFEARTGLSEILYAQSQRQLRSATEADIKQQNARIRPDDMSDIVADVMTTIARKEAILALFLLEPDEVEKVVGSQFSPGDLGFALSVVYGGQELPPEVIGQMPQLAGQLGEYYASPDEAQNAAMQIGQAFAVLGMAIQPVAVTPKRVWQDAKQMKPENIVREFTYTIESGSMRRRTPQVRLQEAMQQLNTVGSVAIQSGDYNAYNALLGAVYDAAQTPFNERVTVTPPPPPPQPMALPQGQPANG